MDALHDPISLLADEAGRTCSCPGPHTCLGGLAAQERSVLATAIQYLLTRQQTDPDTRWVIGPGTEAFRKLCLAEAELTGKTFDEIEQERRLDLQPDHRRRDPEVLELRKRLQELEG